MAGEQLRFYAAERAGRTAVIGTDSGDVVAWIEVLPSGLVRARRGAWMSSPVETIPQAIREVGERR
ncbi:hypothetical protein [Demequina iriomotensis]|uniref:hypothetical protein n=1 Tax=Demequina iriomotensis TaxID=1536641 RepID=UPI000A4D767B|nr:hypothetical protein [Demequina iriomotensis]